MYGVKPCRFNDEGGIRVSNLHQTAPRHLSVNDLAGVIYSSGKVFDNLSTGRLDTENFLRSGTTAGITSRPDLALLQDLRDVADFIVANVDREVDADYVRDINRRITRSGPLNPGEFRRKEQQIGVRTQFGRHEPAALNDLKLQSLISNAVRGAGALENSIALFLALAKAQPFEDGNKRTALFAANGYLLHANYPNLLTVPFSDQYSNISRKFNELLARYYVYDEPGPITDYLRQWVRESALIERDQIGAEPEPVKPKLYPQGSYPMDFKKLHEHWEQKDSYHRDHSAGLDF